MTEQNNRKEGIPELCADAVLVVSEELPKDTPTVKGFDFNKGCNLDDLLKSYIDMGFQATNLGLAIDEINRMLNWRLSDEEPLPDEDEYWLRPEIRQNTRCTIFFSYTSNQVSCGQREIIRYLAQHKLVDCIVTTGGGIEEDIIKCMAPFYIGDFSLKGRDLRLKGINRTGNLLVPNKNYCLFEDFMMPILDQCLKEQKEQGVLWTPSKLINRLGREINNEESIYYWCWKNDIPVFCPAITDGSVGDMIFFHSFVNPGLVLDIVEDIRGINKIALGAKKTGQIILGGGLVKHHVCNANLMRNGADFSVYINTAQEFDGSDAGARPDEAISWGKIKINAKPVKVYAEATLVFPLIVSQTFYKWQEAHKNDDRSKEIR